MITLIYPKEDWTSAELSTKLQALASSRDIEFYTTPKHGKRDEEHIARKLSNTDKAIFLAHDITSLDENTRWELKSLIKNNADIYLVAPDPLESELRELGFDNSQIYSYEEGDSHGFHAQINKLMSRLDEQSPGEGGDLAAFLIILGLLLLLLWLLSTLEE